MTGYGKAVGKIQNKNITVEIKSVNSKSFDLNLRLSSVYKEKELELRSDLSKQLERGKIDLSVYIEKQDDTIEHRTINKELATTYFNDLKNLSEELKIPGNNYLEILMKMPDIFVSEKTEVDDGEWKQLFAIIQQATQSFNDFRSTEGKNLAQDITNRIYTLQSLSKQIETLSPQRTKAIKLRLQNSLNEFINPKNVDANRFEQELIYYLEKLDFTEEIVRLKSHCDYFLSTLKESGANGRKLGFITQEIGREINTIGSKASDAVIQKLVVQMKDELEKIKEQLLNVL